MSEDGTTRATISDFFAVQSDDRGGVVQFASDELDAVFWLTQTQPEAEATPAPRPTRSRSRLVTARRRRSSYRLPSMFGDFYGGSSLLATIISNTVPTTVNFPAGGGAARRVKIGENNSAIPRDRFIFNYNFFNDVIDGIGDVNRYTVGFEHTLFSGDSSIEVLFPMASTMDVDQIVGGMPSTDTELGDLTLIYKHLLFEREQFLVSAGFGLTVPTGDDARIFNTIGQQLIDVEHSSTHLLPFLGMLRTYDSGWYWQAFMQLDIDLNGNPVSADAVSGMNLKPIGVLQDQTLMFVDFGAGYWLRRPNQGTRAVALTAELHWAGTLQNADVVNGVNVNIKSVNNRYDVLNLTLGGSVLFNDRFTVRPAMVIPLADGDGEQFDYEAMVQMNFWR